MFHHYLELCFALKNVLCYEKFIKDEIGDVMIYLANLSDKYGIDPLEAAHEELKKTSINIRLIW
ncbi:MAG: hypothetical protein KAI29_08255 [Cyclobacteriaceae bacterium]|nr:hypothetical protein [Cyclobacteriaceae bacterium]